MTLHEHKQIVKRWINSCDMVWQLDLFPKFINDFILPKFIADKDYHATKQELIKAIEWRKKVLATPSLHAPEHSQTIGRNNHLNDLP